MSPLSGLTGLLRMYYPIIQVPHGASYKTNMPDWKETLDSGQVSSG